MRGLLGKKLGMTRIFDEEGNVVPVTTLEVGPCVVTQVKTVKNDGYDAVQVGYGKKKKRITKGLLGHLKKAGLDIIIKEYFKKGKPILAICLGFQMLFKSSDEFKITKGLSFLSGQVRSLKSLKTKEIIPNLGWRKINFTNNKKNFLFQKISPKPKLYFIHSYCVETTNKKYITSTTEFGRKKIVSSIQYKNLYGVQFHPDKSGYGGLQIIKNFLKKSKKFNEDKIQLTKKG